MVYKIILFKKKCFISTTIRILVSEIKCPKTFILVYGDVLTSCSYNYLIDICISIICVYQDKSITQCFLIQRTTADLEN